jgi:putative addiction module component (TIGR02574 family)
MSEIAQSILSAALGLPFDERAELIDRLLENDAPPDNYAGMSDDDFQAEMNRRCEETLNGMDPGISSSEVRRILKEDIDAIPDR